MFAEDGKGNGNEESEIAQLLTRKEPAHHESVIRIGHLSLDLFSAYKWACTTG